MGIAGSSVACVRRTVSSGLAPRAAGEELLQLRVALLHPATPVEALDDRDVQVIGAGAADQGIHVGRPVTDRALDLTWRVADVCGELVPTVLEGFAEQCNMSRKSARLDEPGEYDDGIVIPEFGRPRSNEADRASVGLGLRRNVGAVIAQVAHRVVLLVRIRDELIDDGDDRPRSGNRASASRVTAFKSRTAPA